MGSRENIVTNALDANLEKAYAKYALLKQKVEDWQQERGFHWGKTLELAETPPYLPLVDLPAEAIIELWQELNSTASVDITDEKLMQIWQTFCNNQSLHEQMDEEMSTRFQMAIRGVAQLAAKMVADKVSDEGGVGFSAQLHNNVQCPVCGETTSLAVVTPPGGKRIMHCNSCDHEWTVKRIKCLHCGSEDAKNHVYLNSEEFPGIEMVVCKTCGQYFKEIDIRKTPVKDFMWEDIRTLSLNYSTELWLAKQAEENKQLQ